MRAIFGFAVALLAAVVPLVAAQDMAAPPQVLPQCAVCSSRVPPPPVGFNPQGTSTDVYNAG
jgi:hypothetical protein